ncbi:hypothetical protein E2P84_31270 [Burkholderia cepacia]|uniref:Uncharacterized protein n=1 Tax=Burkholderia cepacia TaxID=292 RepID=A0AAX2RD91_BURCE|nr:DUF5677 domain-containing protein [Burkholderia cepacia]TES70170.1 hypothetical protein E2P84_31270 [Burkholderia cepacia]TES97471.1 hypothetical protein E3D36_32490 [Burkholderia cepacia]TEU35300.1 hypothetical protein E3D37_37830 [Burkholderia cepacia]TEU40428.1 hypothetical protein E3D38_34685 [Burkholderia cepacia]TEU86569.1 hypothetical protein E3D40_40530 [Burkholderia cepacia]
MQATGGTRVQLQLFVQARASGQATSDQQNQLGKADSAMTLRRDDFAAKGFLSPEIETERNLLREKLAESIAAVEAASDRVTARSFAADVSQFTEHEILAFSFWLRCLGACQGGMLLAERGMASEALVLVRSGFEFLFFGAALLVEPRIFASLANGHDFERRKQARDMIRAGSEAGHLTEEQIALLREVEEEGASTKAPISAFDAAETSGLGFLYASAYRGLSMMASHATIAGTDSVLETQPDGTIKAVFGPSMSNVQFALGLIQRCLETAEAHFAPLLGAPAH